jgi:hypothetical protein
VKMRQHGARACALDAGMCDGLWSDARLCCTAARMTRVMEKLGAETGHGASSSPGRKQLPKLGRANCIQVPPLSSSNVGKTKSRRPDERRNGGT